MREIKFRGLRTDGQGWVYGYYYQYNGQDIICYENHSDSADTYHYEPVLPESVGQFTGLKDNNGTDIYEGDVITYNFLAFESYNSFNSKIFWDEFMWLTDDHSLNRLSNIEVIGNIHENPELL